MSNKAIKHHWYRFFFQEKTTLVAPLIAPSQEYFSLKLYDPLPGLLQRPVLLNVFHIIYFNMLRGWSVFKRPFYVSTFLFPFFFPLFVFFTALHISNSCQRHQILLSVAVKQAGSTQLCDKYKSPFSSHRFKIFLLGCSPDTRAAMVSWPIRMEFVEAPRHSKLFSSLFFCQLLAGLM